MFGLDRRQRRCVPRLPMLSLYLGGGRTSSKPVGCVHGPTIALRWPAQLIPCKENRWA